MPTRNQAALDFLLSRKSYPAKMMTGPVPSRSEISEILTAAARGPDHGKLVPWRFIVLNAAALSRLGRAMLKAGPDLGIDPEKVTKSASTYAQSELAIVVVSAPVPSEKVPQSEQVLSAGAVCLALVNAATAAGWGANWLSGWASHDATFVQTELGLAPTETVAGIIHIGTQGAASPERPRPDLALITEWVES